MAPPNPTSPDVESVLEATQTIFDKFISVLADMTKTLGKTFDVSSQMNEGFTANLRLQMIRDYGGQIAEVTKEQFERGDFSKIVNEGERAIVRSLKDMDTYMKDLQIYEGLDPKEIEVGRQTILKDFGDFNINLLKKNNAEITKQTMLFSKGMNISLQDTANLVKLNFAKTGEASAKILTEITNNAKVVGDAAGVPLKVMADGIAEVMTDMKTFTDITVQSAARMTAKLSQLGLSLSEFKEVLSPFRDFDSAATKIGDLSAMFGVQMDAMEMMYLANENEEEFLNRFRDQILDQGIDVETMSKTRQRALADQLGMNVETMKMFLNSQMSYTEASELMAASGEAAGKTQVDAQTEIEKGLVLAVRNSRELTDAMIATQAVLRTFDVTNFTQQMGKLQKSLLGAANDENKLREIMKEISDFGSSNIAKAAGFAAEGAEYVRQSIPAVGPEQLKAAKDAGRASPAAFAEGVREGTSKIEAAIDPMRAKSWPKILQEMANGFGSDKDGKPNKQMDFYVQTINQWSDTLSKTVVEGVEKITKSFDLSKLTTNFQSSLKIAAEEMTRAMESLPTLNDVESKTVESFSDRIKSELARQSVDFKEMSEENKKLLASLLNLNQENLTKFMSDSTTPTLPAITALGTVQPEQVPSRAAEAATAEQEAQIESVRLEEGKSAVKFDTENLKKEIVEAIKEGFSSGNYGFELFLDGKSIATSLRFIKDNEGRRIQFVG